MKTLIRLLQVSDVIINPLESNMETVIVIPSTLDTQDNTAGEEQMVHTLQGDLYDETFFKSISE